MSLIKITTTFLLVLFCHLNSFTQPLWEKTSDLPGGATGIKIVSHLYDVNTRWCLSQGGEGLFRTTDNGQTWENIGLVGVGATDMIITQGNYIVSANDGIHKSTDEGATWTHHNIGIEGLYLTSLTKFNPIVGILHVGTANNGAFFSVDGGETWETMGTGLENETITSLINDPFNEMWVATTAFSGVWVLNSITNVWEQENNGNSNLNNEAIESDSKGKLYLASDPYILTSPGANIQWQISAQFEFPTDFAVTPDDEIFASSLGFGVMKRDVIGLWANYSEGLPADNDRYIDVTSIDIGPDGKLWVTIIPLDPVFDDGIYKTISPVTDVEGISSEIPNTFKLEQNYPNPFNPSTTIKYSIPKESFVTLKIYNLIGEEVAALVNEEQTIGNYEVDFNAAGLSSGIYFYKLQAEGFVETKKMVLLK